MSLSCQCHHAMLLSFIMCVLLSLIYELVMCSFSVVRTEVWNLD